MTSGNSQVSILAVDDDAKTLFALHALLESMALKVEMANSGEEALRCVAEQEFAVILMDARMPGMDGFETVRLIREREGSRSTPVIFLTGAYEDASDAFRGYEAGAVDYLVKPIVPEILKSKISVFVNLHKYSAKLIREIIERKKVEGDLRQSEESLRALAAHLQSVREEEWTRISREIHDELGQVLTGLKMDLTWISDRLSQEQADLGERAKRMSGRIDEAVRTIRRVASRLRPDVLDRMGLPAAIEWQASDFQRQTGIRCNVSLPPETGRLDPELSTAAFRIFQELLTNVARHANATRVDVVVDIGSEVFALAVEDNGKGVEPGVLESPKSLGLLGVRERVVPFGGEVEIAGIRNRGTRVKVSIPHSLK